MSLLSKINSRQKYFSDPVTIPELTQSIISNLQHVDSNSTQEFVFERPRRRARGLERLPPELLDYISEFLDFHSVMALHQTSKWLALKIPLNERFWRRCLCTCSLLPHIWDLDQETMEKSLPGSITDATWDWERLVRFLTQRLYPADGTVLLGFWNRRRIWSIVEEACTRDPKFFSAEYHYSLASSNQVRCDFRKAFLLTGFVTILLAAAAWDTRSAGGCPVSANSLLNHLRSLLHPDIRRFAE